MNIYVISDIIIVIGVIWAVSGFFQYMQIIKMNNVLHRLGNEAPRVFRGTNGKFLALRLYILAAASAEGKIVDASYIHTSFLLKPAREVRAEQLIGQYIPEIEAEHFQQDQKIYKAVCSLKEDFRMRHSL